MKPNEIVTWVTIAAALLGAGIWLGALENRVTSLEQHESYYHGVLDPRSVK